MKSDKFLCGKEKRLGDELRKMSLKGRIIFNSSRKLIWPFIWADFGEITARGTQQNCMPKNVRRRRYAAAADACRA